MAVPIALPPPLSLSPSLVTDIKTRERNFQLSEFFWMTCHPTLSISLLSLSPVMNLIARGLLEEGWNCRVSEFRAIFSNHVSSPPSPPPFFCHRLENERPFWRKEEILGFLYFEWPVPIKHPLTASPLPSVLNCKIRHNKVKFLNGFFLRNFSQLIVYDSFSVWSSINFEGIENFVGTILFASSLKLLRYPIFTYETRTLISLRFYVFVFVYV